MTTAENSAPPFQDEEPPPVTQVTNAGYGAQQHWKLESILGLIVLAGFIGWVIASFISDPSVFAQVLTIGLSNGALYALIALGYTMVYGIIELINFAHGDLFMLGSFLALQVALWLGVAGAGGGPGEAAVVIALMLVAAPVFCAALNLAI